MKKNNYDSRFTYNIVFHIVALYLTLNCLLELINVFVFPFEEVLGNVL